MRRSSHAPDAGAVAFFGSSAVTRDAGHRDLALGFHHAFWREPDLRLGDMALRAYQSVAWRADAADLVGSFLLFGDPALRPNVDGTPSASARLVSVSDRTAYLSGAESRDPDGSPLAFRWEIVEGTGATLDDASSVTPTLSGPPGPYRVRLTVADSHRAGPADDLVVELRAAPDGGSDRSPGLFGCSVGSPAGRSAFGLPLILLACVACFSEPRVSERRRSQRPDREGR